MNLVQTGHVWFSHVTLKSALPLGKDQPVHPSCTKGTQSCLSWSPDPYTCREICMRRLGDMLGQGTVWHSWGLSCSLFCFTFKNKLTGRGQSPAFLSVSKWPALFKVCPSPGFHTGKRFSASPPCQVILPCFLAHLSTVVVWLQAGIMVWVLPFCFLFYSDVGRWEVSVSQHYYHGAPCHHAFPASMDQTPLYCKSQ